MRADEIRDASGLARLTLRGSTTRIHELHRGIADRTFRAVGPVGRAWAELGVAVVVGLPTTVAAMLLLRVPELAAARRRLRSRATSSGRPT